MAARRKAPSGRPAAKPGSAGKARARTIRVTAASGRTAEIPAPRFFATQAAWRAWLAKHHATGTELWVGYHKVGSGKPSMTWPQSVDEALCFGWIDGIRRRLDEVSYAIRFTPRKPTSIWSNVNVKRYGELDRLGLILAAGRAAFEKKTAARTGVYAYEKEHPTQVAETERRLRADAKAWAWYNAQTPGYRRLASGWVIRAKREETCARRLETLLDCCRRGVVIPPLVWMVRKTARPARD